MRTIALFLAAAALTGLFFTTRNEADQPAEENNQSEHINVNAAEHALAAHDCNHVHAYHDDGFDGMLGRETSTTLGNAVYDRKMREEVANQRRFFQGVPAEVVILDEKHVLLRNAYANANGKIYFGKNMFYYTIRRYNELAVAGILAHEWGHRVQYTFGFHKDLANPELELEADAMSGYYMALNKGFEWAHIHGYFASTMSTGDYDVESPRHHGTPNQRVAAAYLGVQLAIESVNTDHAFTYEELHHRILDSLRINVTQKADVKPVEGSRIREIAEGKISGKEIAAPVLSAQEREKYFPYRADN